MRFLQCSVYLSGSALHYEFLGLPASSLLICSPTCKWAVSLFSRTIYLSADLQIVACRDRFLDTPVTQCATNMSRITSQDHALFLCLGLIWPFFWWPLPLHGNQAAVSRKTLHSHHKNHQKQHILLSLQTACRQTGNRSCFIKTSDKPILQNQIMADVALCDFCWCFNMSLKPPCTPMSRNNTNCKCVSAF